MGKELKYDNDRYWKEIHRIYKGQLKSVGWPSLSETFNVVNYRSQSKTLEEVLGKIRNKYSTKPTLKILDIGAGTGYFSVFIKKWFEEEGFSINLYALDISSEALDVISKINPSISTIQYDISKIDPNIFAEKFDIVYSFFCLHHIVNEDGYINGLTFAARSLLNGGSLIIMDPLLTKTYSPYYLSDNKELHSNGLPRKLLIQDIYLLKENLIRTQFEPLISFLLAGNIEAKNKVIFVFEKICWQILQKIYRSDILSKFISPIIFFIDSSLKKKGCGNSAGIVVYSKGLVEQYKNNQAY